MASFKKGAMVLVEGDMDRLGVVTNKSNFETGKTLVSLFSGGSRRQAYCETAILKKFNAHSNTRHDDTIARYQEALEKDGLFDLLH